MSGHCGACARPGDASRIHRGNGRNGAALFAGHDLRAIDANEDARVHLDAVHVVGVHGFLYALEHAEFALVAFAVDGDVVGSQHDVLRGADDRGAIGGREDVVRGSISTWVSVCASMLSGKWTAI